MEECTGPPHPDPQGDVPVLNTAPSLPVSATWREARDRRGLVWRVGIGRGEGSRGEELVAGGEAQQEGDLRAQSTLLEPRGGQTPGQTSRCSHLDSEIVISVGKSPAVWK